MFIINNREATLDDLKEGVEELSIAVETLKTRIEEYKVNGGEAPDNLKEYLETTKYERDWMRNELDAKLTTMEDEALGECDTAFEDLLGDDDKSAEELRSCWLQLLEGIERKTPEERLDAVRCESDSAELRAGQARAAYKRQQEEAAKLDAERNHTLAPITLEMI